MPRQLPPASFFGMPAGVLGLGLAWRSAVKLWALPPIVPELVLALGGAIWATVVAGYLGKWVWSRAEAEAELEHPVQCCFVGLGPVTTSLMALSALPYSRPVAVALFAAGAAGTLGFALYRTGRLWMGGREVAATTAVLYLPAVAGGFVTAGAAAGLGWAEWGQLAFGTGAFSWLAIESVLLMRLYTGPEMAPPLRPTLGIQLAPPAVGALAYLQVAGGGGGLLAKALLGYALLQALLLLRLARWIGVQPLGPSYWAFSFGGAALSAAAIRLALAGSEAARTLAAALFLAANAGIAVLAALTAVWWVSGRLLPSSPAPTPQRQTPSHA